MTNEKLTKKNYFKNIKESWVGFYVEKPFVSLKFKLLHEDIDSLLHELV